MKKIALLLALLMIIGCFAACGGDSEKNEAGEPAATGGTAGQHSAAPDSGEVDTEACAVTDNGKHHYAEELAGEPSCALPGLMIYTCDACGFSTSKEIPALGHQGTGASCVEASICTVCGEVEEDAWGHEPDGGICKNCGDFLFETDGTNPTQEAAGEATEEAASVQQ